MDVEALPCAMDTINANPYSFLAHLGRAEGIRLVDGGVVARLPSDIPVPLFNSVVPLRFTGVAAMAT